MGERVQEEETVTFEAMYSGNPTPGTTISLLHHAITVSG